MTRRSLRLEPVRAKRARTILAAAAALSILAFGLLDYLTGIEIGFSIFYVLPLAGVAWYGGRGAALGLAGFATIIWLAADGLGGHDHSHALIPFWNALVRLGFFATIVWALGALRDLYLEKAAFVRELGDEVAGAERARQDLERSNEELERYAHVAAHDLRSPLVTVGGYMRLLERRYGPELGPDAEVYLRHALEGVDRMEALIDDLLDYAKLDGPRPARAPTDLGRALTRALEALRAEVEESGARIQREVLPEVLGHEERLARLFQNLVGNAIKFRRETPPLVRVWAERGEGAWVISVEDNGIGIPPEQLGDVFAPFHRLHGGSEYSGTGMGLAICKKIAEQHGGRIWAESEPGQGTTFRFTLTSSDQTPA